MTKTKRQWVSPDELAPGMILADDIFNSTHTLVMLGKGSELDYAMVEKLKEMDLYEIAISVQEEVEIPDAVVLPSAPVSNGHSNGGSGQTSGWGTNGDGLQTQPTGTDQRRKSLWQKQQPDAKACVLIWSNSPARRATAGRALIPLGIAILEAGNPQEIFNHLQENAVDLLVVDLRFSEGQGWELLGLLPEIASGKVPLMILSDSDAKENVLMAKKHKAKGYLIWPQPPENFRKRVAGMLNLPAV